MFAYFDIDNFKAYNDVYGFENGDLVIKLLADVFKSKIAENQFVGHIGGDDFVVIIDHIVKEDYFNNIIDQFEKEVLELYNDTDRAKGYIVTKNRRGDIEKFPLITLTVVTVNNKNKIFENRLEISEELVGLKNIAKQKKKSKQL